MRRYMEDAEARFCNIEVADMAPVSKPTTERIFEDLVIARQSGYERRTGEQPGWAWSIVRAWCTGVVRTHHLRPRKFGKRGAFIRAGCRRIHCKETPACRSPYAL